jgi:ABC-type transporter Mla subunit MlaD
VSLLAQDQRVTRAVGAVAMALGVLAIVFFVFLWDRIEWGERVRLRVYFGSTGGLQEGAAVVVAGHDIGKVESIALATRPKHDDGVIVVIAVDAEWAKRVDANSDVFVTSRGALSGRYLEIGPHTVSDRFPAGTKLADIARDKNLELDGREPPTLDRVLQRTLDNLNTTAAFAADVKPALAHLQRELDALQATMDGIAPDIAFRADVAALIAEGRQTREALGGDAGIARMGDVMDRGGNVITQARATIAQLRASADILGASIDTLKSRVSTRGATAIERVELAIDRIKLAIDKIDPLLAQAELLQQQIARGEGSLLKLMNDPEFPEDAKELGKILKRQPWKILDRPIP